MVTHAKSEYIRVSDEYHVINGDSEKIPTVIIATFLLPDSFATWKRSGNVKRKKRNDKDRAAITLVPKICNQK